METVSNVELQVLLTNGFNHPVYVGCNWYPLYSESHTLKLHTSSFQNTRGKLIYQRHEKRNYLNINTRVRPNQGRDVTIGASPSYTELKTNWSLVPVEDTHRCYVTPSQPKKRPSKDEVTESDRITTVLYKQRN